MSEIPGLPEGTDLDDLEPGVYRSVEETPDLPVPVRRGMTYIVPFDSGVATTTVFDDGEAFVRWVPDTGPRRLLSCRPGEEWRDHGEEWQEM